MLEIIPELAVRDLVAAEAMLTQVFGFRRDGDFMVSGSQRIALVAANAAGNTAGGHGGIDHLALKVNDVDAALRDFQTRGAVIDDTTPNGPQEIAEFWDQGVRYVFLRGPEGARIELCARRGAAEQPDLPGHDHIGVPCTDTTATEAFLLSLGLTLVARFVLVRPEGTIPVHFLSAGNSVVELYGPPGHNASALSQTPLWRGLRLLNSDRSGIVTGPDGLTVTLV